MNGRAEIIFNVSENTRAKDTCVVRVPVKVCRIENRSLMYTEIFGYKHPVIIWENHFTIPKNLQEILKKNGLIDSTQKIRLVPIKKSEDYFYLGTFHKGKSSGREYIWSTIDKKIRELLNVRKKDVVEIKVGDYRFIGRIQWQTNKKTLFIFVPIRSFEFSGLKTNVPYQIQIRKSAQKIVSNEHHYIAERGELKFSNFVKNGYLDLRKFLINSYAFTRSGKLRKFKTETNSDELIFWYDSGSGPSSKKIKINPNILVDSNFFRILGLIQAEGSKSIKKPFCFTNTDPKIIKYIVDYFENYFNYRKEFWTYEVALDPRVKNIEKISKFWSDIIKIDSKLIRIYKKNSIRNTPQENGIMNLRGNRTIKQLILRLLETVKDYIKENKSAAGNFLSGVLAGDGWICTTNGTLHHISICFDPNKIWVKESDELKLYLDCLKSIGIPKEDTRIYITDHQKSKKFVETMQNSGIGIRVRKSSTLGFGGELKIFKFRNFDKLNTFSPFYPNKINQNKFISGFSKINRDRIRYR